MEIIGGYYVQETYKTSEICYSWWWNMYGIYTFKLVDI